MPTAQILGGKALKLPAMAATAAHDKDINSVAFSPNDALLCTGSQDRTAKVGWCCGQPRGVHSAAVPWHALTPEHQPSEVTTGVVLLCAACQDGLWLSATGSQVAQLLQDHPTGATQLRQEPVRGVSEALPTLHGLCAQHDSVHNDGAERCAGWVQVWRMPDLVLTVTLHGHRRGIWAVAFSPVDQCVATASGEPAASSTDLVCSTDSIACAPYD